MLTDRNATIWIAAQVLCLLACSSYDEDLLQPPAAQSESVMGLAGEPTTTQPAAADDGGQVDPGSEIDPDDPAVESSPKDNGAQCGRAAECASGHCNDGLCCDAGNCCQTADDCRHADQPAYLCLDATRCQGVHRSFECTQNRCTQRDEADDRGCDANVQADMCKLYPTISCTGKPDQSAPRCASECSGDEQCDGPAHCEKKACVLDLASGGSCTRDAECQGGHCNHGICCAHGDCCARAADCPASYGGAAHCDDATHCQGTRPTAMCVDSICSSSKSDDDSACSASTLARSCDTYTDVHCTGAREQQAPACQTTCNDNNDCDSNAHCTDGHCEADRGNGSACSASAQCASQYCSGGHCCNGGDCCASDADCESSSTCVDPGTCQGVTQERTCNPDSQCADGARRADPAACVGQVARSCGAYRDVRCAVVTVSVAWACGTSCTSAWECNWGYSCEDGSCVAP